MLPFRVATLFVSFLLFSACLSAHVTGDEGTEQLMYYLRTEDPAPQIAAAMEQRKVVIGMTKAQARLVMGAKKFYDAEPTRTETTREGRKRWVFRHRNGGQPYVITIGPDGLVDSHTPESRRTL